MRIGRPREGDRVPVPLLGVLPVRGAARRPRLPRPGRGGLVAGAAARRRMARPGVRRRVGRRGRDIAAGRAGADRRSLRAVAAGHRRRAQLRRRRELEDPHRELPRVLPLLHHPPGAVPGQPAAQRGELRGFRGVDRRLDVAARRDGDDVAGREQRRCPAPGPVGRGAPDRGLCGDFPERPVESPSRLCDDPPAGPPGGGPHPDRVQLGVRAGGRLAGGLRPGVRRRLLGPDQPAGLGRVRVGAARAVLAVRVAGPAGAGRGRGVRVRDRGRPRLPGRARHGDAAQFTRRRCGTAR